MDATEGFSLINFQNLSKVYLKKLQSACDSIPLEKVEDLANALLEAWTKKSQVFIFGNGGSAGNAIHLANDFIFGISRVFGSGLKIHALPSNVSVITCLANDIGYENIFEYQLSIMSNPGDIIIALSGSGNSPNIVRALEYGAKAKLQTFAILGYSGGKALRIAQTPIHINIDDMQIAEDLQLIIGHLLMQYLNAHRGPLIL